MNNMTLEEKVSKVTSFQALIGERFPDSGPYWDFRSTPNSVAFFLDVKDVSATIVWNNDREELFGTVEGGKVSGDAPIDVFRGVVNGVRSALQGKANEANAKVLVLDEAPE